jgi:hypothetical protein
MQRIEAIASENGSVTRPNELDDAWLELLDARERKELERARERGFLVYFDSQPNLARVWWRWCEAAGQPHVAIKNRYRYAWVMLDMPAGVELSPRALKAARDAVQQRTPHGGWGYGTHAVGHPQVPRERAESLAEQLRDIAKYVLRRG